MGEYTIRIGGISTGTEGNGKQVDNKIVFLADRDKIVCHLYNTTCRILVNGHGYKKFMDLFLIPFFKSKITLNTEETDKYNDLILEKLSTRTVRRSNVTYKGGEPFTCNKCEYASKTISNLNKHKKTEHTVSFNVPKARPGPLQSTRNNSLTEPIMLEDISLTALQNESITVDENSFKFTCLNCNFISLKQEVVDAHIREEHGANQNEEVKFNCMKCGHEFDVIENYNTHLRIHDKKEPQLEVKAKDIGDIENKVYNYLLEEWIKTCDSKEKILEKKEEDECNKYTNLQRDTVGLGTHKRSVHGNKMMKMDDFDEIVELTCKNCDFEGESKEEMNEHHKTIHVVEPEEKCNYCEVRFKTKDELKEHTNNCQGTSNIKCNLCEFTAKCRNDIEKHLQNKHFSDKIITMKGDNEEFTCQQCQYKCNRESQLNMHLLVKHEKVEHYRYTCEFCGFASHYILNLWNHREEVHADLTPVFVPKPNTNQDSAIAYLAEQNLELMEEIETMKKDFKGAFEQHSNDIEDHLKLLREEAKTHNEEVKSAIAHLISYVGDKPPAGRENVNNHEQPKHKENRAEIIPVKPEHEKPKKPQNTLKPKTHYQARPKVLLVGDSIGRNVEFPRIEKDNRCNIKTASAYSSVYDETTRWPDNNFTKVAKEELSKKHYDYLIMSAPTEDITSIDTSKLNKADNTAVYQQKALSSSQNMFDIAREALDDHPNIKKVIIMEHTTRHDTSEADPVGLKPGLARYANNVLHQLWLDSGMKDEIVVVAAHTTMDTLAHDDLFRNRFNGMYDGIHHFGKSGRKSFSISFGNILKNNLANGLKNNFANNIKDNQSSSENYHKFLCPQALYQKRKSTKSGPQHQTGVATSNRFSVFNSNQGNL